MSGEEEKDLISLNDLASIRNIISVASRRGAFEASEFEEIGKVYTKLDNFLNKQAKLLKEQEANQEDVSGVGESVEGDSGGNVD